MTQLDIRRAPEGDPGYPPPPADLPEKGVSQVLWRGRWIILVSALLLLGAGFLYAAKQTPIFASTSRLLVEQEGPKIINDGMSGGQQSSNYLATQCQLIASSQILNPVAESPRIRQLKMFEDVDNPIGLLKLNLAVDVGQKDDVITVSFESPYAPEAAEVVNMVVASYYRHYAERRRMTSAEVLQALTKDKKQYDVELHDKMQEMLDYKQAHPNLTYSGEKGGAVVQQRNEVGRALAVAHTEMIELKGLFDAAKAIATSSSRMDQWLRQQQGGGPTAGLLAEVQRLEIEEATQRQTLGPVHPTIRALQARIADMRQRIADQNKESFDAYMSVLEQRVNAAQRREAELQADYDKQEKTALEYNTESAKYQMFENDIHRLEKMTDMLDERIKTVKLNDGLGVNIQTLEVGKQATAPIKPKKAIILFEALSIGLALGVGLAYLREAMDMRLGSLDEIRAMMNLNILGVLPHMPGKETQAVRGQKVQLDPMSEVAEGYRTVRTAVYFGAPEGRTKTILVTSPAPGDGKSTSASNLAIAMAQAGQRVLLLDADFRKPVQHKIFGIEDGVGLSSVVAGQTPLSKAVKASGTKGLYVLPCGPVPRNPSEILNSQVFSQLMAKLAEKFDHIVVDSPPVMPVTDARILGASCDVTILVVRAQKSTKKITLQARDSLLSVGSRILGLVVNDVPRGRSAYNVYNYGYSYYGRPYANGRPKVLEGKTNGARLPAAAAAGDE